MSSRKKSLKCRGGNRKAGPGKSQRFRGESKIQKKPVFVPVRFKKIEWGEHKKKKREEKRRGRGCPRIKSKEGL